MTITVNKKNKSRQTLLELARILAENSKGIRIDENQKSRYNPEFVKMIREREAKLKSGESVPIKIDPKDVWRSLG